MNNPVIYWVIGGLLILFFFFLIYKFTSTWRVWHILAVFFMFAAALAMCVLTSLSLRTHFTWRTQAFQLSTQLDQEEATRDDLLHGNLLEVAQTKPTIRSLTADEQRALLDRGRVWRGCVPSQVTDDDTVTVSLPVAPAAPAEPEAAAPPAAPGVPAAKPAPKPAPAAVPAEPAIQENMVLHIFAEDVAPPEENLPAGTKVPRVYLGEFTVSATTESSVTLRPTRALDNDAKQALRATGISWVLYETMPVDSHRALVKDLDKTPDLSKNANEEPIFGTIEPARIQRLFPPPQEPAAQEIYKKTVAEYLRDGTRANQDDPPETVWLKVRFTQAFKEDVDTAGDPVGAVVSSQVFFDRGRAEIALLRRGKGVEFKKGDIGVFPQEDGNRLIGQKVCELIEPVYVRTLNDYEFGLRNIALQMVQLDEAIRQTERDTAEITRSNELTQQEIKSRQDERVKLDQDKAKTDAEKDRMTTYVAALEQRWAKLRDDMSLLYRTNSELADQLAHLDREMTDRINRGAAAAVSANP